MRFCFSRCTAISLSAFILMISIAFLTFAADGLFRFYYITALTGSNVFTYGITLALAVSLFSAVICPFVIYGVLQRSPSILIVLTFSTLSVGCLGIIGGALGFCLRAELKEGSLKSWMTDGLKNEFGHPYAYDVTDAWDRLQRELICCGVDSPSEWVSSDWFLGQVRYPRRRRPLSCCHTCKSAMRSFCTSDMQQQDSRGSKTCERLQSNCAKIEEDNVADFSFCSGQKLVPEGLRVDAFVYSQGCFEPFNSRLHFYSSFMIMSGLSLALLLFIESLAIFVFICTIDPFVGDYDPVTVG